MKTVVVLGGAGAMGQIIIRDLAEFSQFDQILIADFDKQKAENLAESIKDPRVKGIFADLKEKKILAQALQGATLVINSTPYYFNVDVMRAALEAGCHYMDLGGLFHVTRQQLELHNDFTNQGLLAVLGMGAAPGLTNVMAAAAALELERVHAIDIVIGCVDSTKTNHPFAPPYALDTILDEYSLKPMVFEGYEFTDKEPMSGEVETDFPNPVGKVKAIYTLHSEVATLPNSYSMKGVERVTFRLGLPLEFHERLKFLIELGFGKTELVGWGDNAFHPRKVLAALIQQLPQPEATVDDCEVIRVDVTGANEGKEKIIRMEAIVKSDSTRNISSGALDTGVPPSIVAQMILDGTIARKGVLAPENCIPHTQLFSELEKRNIKVTSKHLEKKKAAVN
jgi:lysine 6-dehydrogenase